ncbi:MAG: hypothetical protein GTO63_13385 [Anaerolineae bacterium]|nr:hypothetical protein [Anaerolineae bacterium]NIN95837.1 hypothetical protein [Anaerolineae bacterium]NIQ78803.1 hypothetical protein [Anaerolineae bacterium]
MTVLSRSELKTLMEKCDRWCVSVFMPTHRAGTETQQDPIRLKNLLKEAEESLVAGKFRGPEAEDLLKPAQELLEHAVFWRHQSEGLAIFLSPDMFRVCRLPLDFEELVVVAERFHIKPLMPLLTGDGRFYTLALSQNEVRLLQGTRYTVGQVDLENVPESLAEALKWNDPERRLQWHTRTGTSTDTMRAAIFHGHGVASADDPKDYIRRYFRQIDEGVSDLLRDERAPLVLAGVGYVLPLYRGANSYQYLLEEGITGNPEELTTEELHRQAWAIVQPHSQREREEAAAQYERLAGAESELVSNEVLGIVPAAYHGRVETLFVALGCRRWGSFDACTNTLQVHEEAKPGDEDLFDFAALHTLFNGGTVYAVEVDKVPDDAPLAAVFRY